MTQPLHELRREVCEICRRCYERGWLSATDGNVSVKIGRDRLLATPSGLHKGFLKPNDLIIVDMTGKRVTGPHRPTTELAMHIACYQERPDVNAVVHMHPTYCIAFSVAGETLAQCLLPEIVFTFGIIPTAPYSAPTTNEVPAAIKKYIHDFDAMILDRHGSLTVGSDLMDAYNKLERMEHVAQITHAARQLGEVKPLTRQQIEQLQEIGDGLGLQRRKIDLLCEQCNACSRGSLVRWAPPAGDGAAPAQNGCGGAGATPAVCAPPPESATVTSSVIPNVDDRVMQVIVEEINRALGERT